MDAEPPDPPEYPADPVGEEGEDLTGSLIALARLSTARLTLEDLLTRVASCAVRAIPGADGAGLTLIEAGRSATVVKSEPFVREIDDIQYGIGEGPCISAAATGQTTRSGSLSGDPRWPRFGPRAGRLGVHSVLSLPLLVQDTVVGAMNVYARPKDAFDDHAEHIGQLFAEPVAIAAQNAPILAQTQRLAANLQAALTNRTVIARRSASSSAAAASPRKQRSTGSAPEPGQPHQGLRGGHQHRRGSGPPRPNPTPRPP